MVQIAKPKAKKQKSKFSSNGGKDKFDEDMMPHQKANGKKGEAKKVQIYPGDVKKLKRSDSEDEDGDYDVHSDI